MSWEWEFDDPLSLPNGDQALTLREIGEYIVTLPIGSTSKPDWQQAIRLLLEAAEFRSRVADAYDCIRQALKVWEISPPIDLKALPLIEKNIGPTNVPKQDGVEVLIASIAKIRALVSEQTSPDATIDAIRRTLDDMQLCMTIKTLERLHTNGGSDVADKDGRADVQAETHSSLRLLPIGAEFVV